VFVLPQAGMRPDLARMRAFAKGDPAEGPLRLELADLPADVERVIVIVLLHAAAPGAGLTGQVRWDLGH